MHPDPTGQLVFDISGSEIVSDPLSLMLPIDQLIIRYYFSGTDFWLAWFFGSKLGLSIQILHMGVLQLSALVIPIRGEGNN
jgi:hypothetical protein